ncbi:MAG: hypothetical protein LAN36_09085 [Acidobacteriia bacterium]|nr:hypothetical protein [Terriglobia bacterium]
MTEVLPRVTGGADDDQLDVPMKISPAVVVLGDVRVLWFPTVWNRSQSCECERGAVRVDAA